MDLSQDSTANCLTPGQRDPNAQAAAVHDGSTLGATSASPQDLSAPFMVRDWRHLRSQTVVITMLPEGRPYRREDILSALCKTPGVDINRIEAVGPTQRGQKWQIVFDSQAQADHLTSEKYLDILTVKREIGMIPCKIVRCPVHAYINREVVLRIGWLPYFVPKEALENLGEVETIDDEIFQGPFCTSGRGALA